MQEVRSPSTLHARFQMMLSDSVTVAMTDVLGSAGARAAFFHLGFNGSADAKHIHEGLVRVFGAGTQALESTILRELFARVGSRFEPEESKTFASYVGDAKKAYQRLKGSES